MWFWGTWRTPIPASDKEAARKGFIELARANDFGRTGLWTRINALNSPWVLDDIVEIMGAVGNKLNVIMLPKVEGPWDIYYLDQLLAQLEAKHGINKPVMIHALWKPRRVSVMSKRLRQRALACTG